MKITKLDKIKEDIKQRILTRKNMCECIYAIE